MTPKTLLDSIARKQLPPIILVGGNNEYLVAEAFGAIRDAILASTSGIQLESFSEGADLGAVIDSYRTSSLFSPARLLVVPEINAFVTKKEISDLLQKAANDWKTAKTDRKRSSAVAKLLHAIGLVGLDFESTDGEIAEALGAKRTDATLLEMLGSARVGGKKPTRGEGDAALLTEAATTGGARGCVLLMRTGEIPKDSATVAAIERHGAVVRCDLTREQFSAAAEEGLKEIESESGVKFHPAARAQLRQRLGIERVLSDKRSTDIPDLRSFLNEAERLATLAGRGGTVSPELVQEQIAPVSGGVRFELGGAFAERNTAEVLKKLRDLVAQAKREDPRTAIDIHYGKFLFTIADEVRQLIAIRSFARVRKIDLRAPVPYNSFSATLADPLSDYLKENGLVRQKPHPFPLHKRYEAAKRWSDGELMNVLEELAEIDFQRKCGGVPADVALESLLLRVTAPRASSRAY